MSLFRFKVYLLLVVFSVLETTYSHQIRNHWTKLKSLRPKIAPAEGRIIGGQEVIPHSYPFTVGLYINYGMYFCAGSLISKNYVLTAAHCGIVIDEVNVILGAHNIKNSSEATQIDISSTEIIVHEHYNGTSFLNDVALIKLPTPVEENEYVKIVKLPSKGQSAREGATVIALGWGMTYDEPYPSINDISSVLKSVNVTVMTKQDCQDVFNDDIPYVTEGNVCTSGYRNTGTCEGDSGGPLVSQDGILIGVVSFGDTLCEECNPSVYADVSKFLDWIEENSDVKIHSEN